MVNARGLDAAGNYLVALSGSEWDMDAVKRSRLIDAAPELKSFAVRVKVWATHAASGGGVDWTEVARQADSVLLQGV